MLRIVTLSVLGTDLEQLSIPLPPPLGSLPACPSPQTSIALRPTWMPTPDLYFLEANQTGLNDGSPAQDKSVGNFSSNFFFYHLTASPPRKQMLQQMTLTFRKGFELQLCNASA